MALGRCRALFLFPSIDGRHLVLTLLACALALPAPAAAAETIPLSGDEAPRNVVKFEMPASWVGLREEKAGVYRFDTSLDPATALRGYLRTFKVPDQTPQAWAQEEANDLASQSTNQLVTWPTALQAGDVTWVMLAWEGTESYHGRIGRFRGEQFYLKSGQTMVEVALFAPLEIFDRCNRPELIDTLSQIRFVKDLAPPIATPEAAGRQIPQERAQQLGQARRTQAAMFQNQRGDVALRFPETWFIREYHDRYPYQVFASRERVTAPGDFFQVGVSLTKFYHQSWYEHPFAPLDPDDAAGALSQCLEPYAQMAATAHLQTPYGAVRRVAVESQRALSLSGAPAVLVEVSFETPSGDRQRVYDLFAMKEDVLVKLSLEAPAAEFERYRPGFDELIRTAVLFAPAGTMPDNRLLDLESERLILERAYRCEKSGAADKPVYSNCRPAGDDAAALVALCLDALAINPLHAKLRMMAAQLFMDLAKGSAGAPRDELLRKAQEQAELAIELYTAHTREDTALERRFNISQCYFLLGDLYYYPYDNPAEAKHFYEQALAFADHPRAKEALQRYQAPTPAEQP